MLQGEPPLSASIGFVLDPGEKTPSNLEEISIPGGSYAALGPYLGKALHCEAWLHLRARLAAESPAGTYCLPGYDEYSSIPFPSTQMMFRTLLRLGPVNDKPLPKSRR
jgi:hypothetical protein